MKKIFMVSKFSWMRKKNHKIQMIPNIRLRNFPVDWMVTEFLF
jgi:hypothetical protein